MSGATVRRRRILLVTADGELGGGSLLVLQSARHLRSRFEVHLATTPGTWLAEQASASGVTVHPGRFLGARGDLRPLRDLRAIVRGVRPEVVHAHGTRSMLHTLSLGPWWLRTGGPLVVHTVHGIHALHQGALLRTLGLAAGRLSSVAASCTTFVSEAELGLARAHRLIGRSHEARVIRNGTPDTSVPTQPVTGHVVWVGRMVEQKDPLLAARTAVALADRGLTVSMVGDGPLLGDVRAVVERASARERVTITGRLDADATEAVVATADVALLTSSWEGLPLVALEALRSGIPLVGADADGVREVLTAEAGATVVARRAPEDLAAAVAAIVGDRTERARRSSAARRVWEDRYRLDRCLGAYADLYDELLRRHSPSAGTGRLDAARARHPMPASAVGTPVPDCSVVIVNFNGGDLVVAAARSALDAAVDAGRTVEVLVVDNDSHDGSAEAVEQIAGVTVVRSGDNVGFPAACNTGIAASTGTVVLLLNPDALLDAEALRAGLDTFAQRPDVTVLGLGQRDGSGRPLPVTYAMPSVWAYLRRQLLARLRPDADRPSEHPIGSVGGHTLTKVDGYLSGACLFARRHDLEALDGLDELLFWAEDADLCRRTTESGGTVALLRDVSVVHVASTTRNRFLDLALFQQYRGYLRFVQVHDGTTYAVTLALVMATEIAGKGVAASLRPDARGRMRLRAYRAVLPALAGWAIGRPSPTTLMPSD